MTEITSSNNERVERLIHVIVESMMKVFFFTSENRLLKFIYVEVKNNGNVILAKVHDAMNTRSCPRKQPKYPGLGRNLEHEKLVPQAKAKFPSKRRIVRVEWQNRTLYVLKVKDGDGFGCFGCFFWGTASYSSIY